MSLISSIGNLAPGMLNKAPQAEMLPLDKNLPGAKGMQKINETLESMGSQGVTGASSLQGSRSVAPSFGSMLEGLVDHVHEKRQTSSMEAQKLMTGESDNLHQSMIAMQESGVAFTLLVEVRNKLVEGYQELMRMQV